MGTSPQSLSHCGTAALLLIVLVSPRYAGAATTDASTACNALESAGFSQIQDAPTQIIGVQLVAPSEGLPEFCEVNGYVAPSVGFLLRLPSSTWNGKLIQVSCGAFCGVLDDHAYAFTCDDPLRRGYACVVTDDGHRSAVNEALWANNNLQAQIDYAYRGAHVTALTAKAIVERYYRNPPKKSYFLGCSDGGRQALMEAQRFPWDFQGIVAGAPALGGPRVHMALLWGNRALTDETGASLVTQADLELVHKAVVAKCDMNDGIKDGVIGDPRECRFDPSELACAAGQAGGCLTVKQIRAVKKVYTGPVTSTGERLSLPTALPGSEQTWPIFFLRLFYALAPEEFRYIAFQPSPGPTWNARAFDFDRDYQRLGIAEGLFSAGNPDLRRFKAAGGKLLAYAGWNDYLPLAAADYYETVQRTMGGRAATQDFFRLFMIPGMHHCAWFMGEKDRAADYLTYLEAWVEKRQAPNVIITSQLKYDDLHLNGPEDGSPELYRRMRFPLDPATVEFSRPVYPYPTQTKYQGHGDPRSASSFVPVEPHGRPNE